MHPADIKAIANALLKNDALMPLFSAFLLGYVEKQFIRVKKDDKTIGYKIKVCEITPLYQRLIPLTMGKYRPGIKETDVSVRTRRTKRSRVHPHALIIMICEAYRRKASLRKMVICRIYLVSINI